ncbi:hypothetical protein GCM10022223_06300 [Kineosporia mesophila]|uniref:Uncharacterized protein n=1 Tax=Kineosporia mesophila TaxID=566012 RepID=A0ABP6YY60_9ACTN
MHLHHEREARRFALDVNGKHLVEDVALNDLIAEGTSWGLPTPRAQKTVEQTVHDLSIALDRINPALYPGVTDEAWARVRDRVVQATEVRVLPTTSATTVTDRSAPRTTGRRKPDGRFGPRPPK